MKKLLLLSAFALFCGGCASTGSQSAAVNQSRPAANTAATNTSAPSNTAAPTNSSAPASNASAASNPDLDFTLVNKTGYDIKEILVGASGTGEWAKEDELLKGRTLTNGGVMDIKFDPRATAERWDLKTVWADGTGGEEWLRLKLTEIEKITLVYDAKKDETTALLE